MKKILFSLALVISGSAAFSQQELVVNGGFENFDQGWDFTLADSAFADIGLCQAHGGDNYLFFGDYWEETGAFDMIDFVTQDIQLPANMHHADFVCWFSAVSDEQDDINEYDFLDILIDNASGQEIFADYFSNTDCDITLTAADCDGWYEVTYTIPSQFAGQLITINFESDVDESFGTIFRIDDVSLKSYASADVATLSVDEFSFYPNPSNGAVTIENPTNEKQGLRISNELGQVVRYEVLDSGKNTIDLTEMSAGIYFIQLGDSKVEKLIVN
jgi:hypothetical protein